LPPTTAWRFCCM
ncbi:hypothetical protein CP8484711_1063, partial [Chlamydia psittaci 84-8471/1]